MRGPEARLALLFRLAAFAFVTGAFEVAHAEDEAPKAADMRGPPGRPPPLTRDSPTANYARDRHVDIGVSFLVVSPISNSLEIAPPTIRYQPGPGVSVFTRIVIHKYLHAAAVFSWGMHGLDADDEALGVDGPLERGSMTAYRLEAHAMPTLPLGERVRLFALVGLGWGRLEVGPMWATDTSGRYLIRGRGASYFDVPAGIGAAITLIPGWMGLDFQMWGAPTFAKDGTAHIPLLVIDAAGDTKRIGPLPEVPVWFAQSLGLSLLL